MNLDSENNGMTYFIDIDGTIVHHKTENDLEELLFSDSDDKESVEELLPNVKEFWTNIEDHDNIIIITTARSEKYRCLTEKIFKKFNLKYHQLIMDLRTGPRVIINDTPDLTFQKAISINVKRDQGF